MIEISRLFPNFGMDQDTMGTTILLLASGLTMFAVTLLIRRNLNHRELARHYRRIFVACADDLIGKPELPEAHARQLLTLVGAPLGIGTRIMVIQTFTRAMTGKSKPAKRTRHATLEQVPSDLLELYVKAIFTFLIADSFHSAFFGPIFRAGNSWLFDAIREVKPDVGAHATKAIVESLMRAENVRLFWRRPDLACA